jgi:catechol 2,3-dioxygenase-like lactoylglutathione lyase family enzyme
MKSSSLGFQSVKVIALAASDVARAKRFYSETLQFEEDREATDEVGYRIGTLCELRILPIKSKTRKAEFIY